MIIIEIILITFIIGLAYLLKRFLDLNKIRTKLASNNPDKLERSALESLEKVAPVRLTKSTIIWITVAIVIAFIVLISMLLYQFEIIRL